MSVSWGGGVANGARVGFGRERCLSEIRGGREFGSPRARTLPPTCLDLRCCRACASSRKRRRLVRRTCGFSSLASGAEATTGISRTTESDPSPRRPARDISRDKIFKNKTQRGRGCELRREQRKRELFLLLLEKDTTNSRERRLIGNDLESARGGSPVWCRGAFYRRRISSRAATARTRATARWIRFRAPMAFRTTTIDRTPPWQRASRSRSSGV